MVGWGRNSGTLVVWLFLTSRPARLGCEVCSELFCPAVRGRWRTLSGGNTGPSPFTNLLTLYHCPGTPTGTCLWSTSGGRFSSKPGEISSMITGLLSSHQSKTQISLKHLESLSFPKRESCTASVGRMFLTVLTGECSVNNDNYYYEDEGFI